VTPRAAAGEIWRAALAAAAVDPLVTRAVSRSGARVVVAGLELTLGRDVDRVVVLGCGKAGAAMAAAVERALGDAVAGGLVVVKDGHARATGRIRVVEAGHPVPDARGEEAARSLLALARGAGARDLVLVLISGGGSALTPAPAPPVTLAEKQQVTRHLLNAGATIGELNAVRKHLSLLKGGQLARAAAPARVVSLILSDVVGDPLDVIASGPTAPDPATFADALAVLERRTARASAPRAVIERLEAGRRGELEETPKPGDPLFARVHNAVIGNNALVADAAAARATALGWRTRVATRELQGEARDAARELVAAARALPPPACLVAAGETTVTVRGSGAGGRCQEFALAAALAIESDDDLVVLAAGTDGTDGPTDAAGGLVDSGSCRRAAAGGVDAHAALAANDAHRFLAASGDLVVTGPTNTNLLDLYLILNGRAQHVSDEV
jgi:hydroxypyruvate reductase